MTSNTSSWKSIVERKRAERASRIPKAWLLPRSINEKQTASPLSLIKYSGLLSQRELELTSEQHDASSLLQQFASCKVTSTELVSAFSKRAAIAHQLTNCLTEILFESAIARAKELDQHLQQTGKMIGPLHGLPITFKDSFHIKGHDASIGITGLCFGPSQRSSLLYDILTAYGAVVIAKTTIPQTLLNADTDSIGTLLALGGTALGIGTDGAGSIRMPAAVNGVVGYKPSGYRLPVDTRRILGTGVVGTTMLGSVTVAGFLGCSVGDVTLAAKLAAEAQPWEKDPIVYPYVWQGLQVPAAHELRIGVWSVNGFLHLHPPVQQGLATAKHRLRSAGVDLVEFQGPDWMELQDLSYLRELLSKETHTERVKATGIITRKTPPPPVTVQYLHTMNARISSLVRQMHAAWSKYGKPIDALFGSMRRTQPCHSINTPNLGFTGLFNLIDWPGVALPLNVYADKNLDRKTPVTPFNALEAEIQDLYDPDTFHGLPLSVQLIGRRFEDEKLLSISQVVHGIIANQPSHPKL
ncbi:amidase signature domain-containing protein [Aspergillus crustosus]